MDRQTLMDRLDSDGATGLDLSPGDPVAVAAARYIRDLEKVLEIVQFELSPGLTKSAMGTAELKGDKS